MALYLFLLLALLLPPTPTLVWSPFLLEVVFSLQGDFLKSFLSKPHQRKVVILICLLLITQVTDRMLSGYGYG